MDATAALSASRRVRHARVHAGARDEGPRWQFLLEDALRTAEFGDAGRLILVRRLTLAGLPARPAPGRAARALEAAWTAQAWQAVPALAPGAAAAPAVWFRSRVHAQAAWLAAWAEDDRALLAHWYWPAALGVPAAAAGGTGAAAEVSAGVWREAQRAAGPGWHHRASAWPDRTLAVLARRWADAGVLPAWALGGERSVAVPVREADADPDALRPAPGVLPLARRMAPHAPLPAAAIVWLAAPWWPQEGSTAPPTAAALGQVVAWVDRLSARPPSEVRVPQTPTDRSTPTLGPAAPVPGGLAPALGAALPAGTPQVAPMAAASAGPASPNGGSMLPAPRRPADGVPPAGGVPVRSGRPAATLRHPALARLASSRPWLADGAPTAHGGLLFVLNLLPGLHFPAWLATQPDAPVFVDRLCLHLLDATGAPPDDPQRAWFDAAGHRAGDARLRPWRLRLRRRLRRTAAMDLGTLVRRPALASGSATHLDLVFPLDEVDLRLRRAGLDLDPGWVPWFGRIVGFHFL